uniref:uroporphyrinogen decarboxylase n=1 Tax=Euglena longa TaxID=3037 RepID=A0A6B9RDL6_EUGLO|nr:uroporphyrinogen decarboxylase [Euglena longa]
MRTVDLAEVNARFPSLQNDNVLRAIRGQSPDRIPVWVMRQAGRYLPEYLEYTKEKEFFSRCQNPEVACHLTLQPFERYDLDAAIIFSDILVVPQALGMEVKMVKGQGPVFLSVVRTREDWYNVERRLLARLGITDVPTEVQDEEIIKRSEEVADALSYVYDAITLTRTRLNGRVPLIGFCGAPWTLFVYASEAKKTKTYTECSKWIYTEPEFVHRILRVLAHVCARFLARQVHAGAQLLQVFESHADALPPKQWREFSLPYLNLIATMVKAQCPGIPMIVLPKNSPFALRTLADSPYDMVSIDQTLDLGESHRAMTAVGKGVQGNVAPTTLYAPPAKVKELVHEHLSEAFGEAGQIPTRYIANLGSGMNPDMDPECLAAFVEAVHAYGKQIEASGDETRPTLAV